MEEVIGSMPTLRDILDTAVNGHNFILTASLDEAREMSHKSIIRAEKEKVYVVIFNEPLMQVLNIKLKQMGYGERLQLQ